MGSPRIPSTGRQGRAVADVLHAGPANPYPTAARSVPSNEGVREDVVDTVRLDSWSNLSQLKPDHGRVARVGTRLRGACRRLVVDVPADQREEGKTGYAIEAPVAGFKPQEIDITFQDGLLSIKAKHKEARSEQGKALRQEFTWRDGCVRSTFPATSTRRRSTRASRTDCSRCVGTESRKGTAPACAHRRPSGNRPAGEHHHLSQGSPGLDSGRPASQLRSLQSCLAPRGRGPRKLHIRTCARGTPLRGASQNFHCLL